MLNLFTYIEISIYKDNNWVATVTSNQLTEKENKSILDNFIILLLKILIYIQDITDFDMYILFREPDKNAFVDPIKDSICILKLLIHRQVRNIKIASSLGDIMYDKKDLINRIEFLYKQV